MSNNKTLLITGATGKQGGAVVDAILASPSKSDCIILGVTRDVNSPGAKKLQAKSPSIKLVQGSYNDIPGLFRSAQEVTGQPVWGVFSVQTVHGGDNNPEKEEKDGKALIDESIKQGVEFFVQASVDRGGDEKSWTTPTPVLHFASKHRIDLYLRDTAINKMNWTILRPAAFMDNFKPDFATKLFFGALKAKLGDKKSLQLVSCHDIGVFAAQAFRRPQDFAGKAISLAGDEVTWSQLEAAFQKATGHGSGASFGLLGTALFWAMRDFGVMIEWFKTDGFGADISKLKIMNPELLDLATWLKMESGWAKK
ncbi:NAD(P)-binding protein [Tothia fuscella]|uniref:NAD(P)-binding protein n=1 Tax=Tothia fuscella TaxID=1048955 RepID=A0A9P4U573_9PEZI|nr:NAD(P)-binding protein [Tothia fuscella]